MKQKTSIEREEVCRDYGTFSRKVRAYHAKSGELIKCRADIPDTYFSIPATTKTEYGFIRVRDDHELEFFPYEKQEMTPAQYRKQYKTDCR